VNRGDRGRAIFGVAIIFWFFSVLLSASLKGTSIILGDLSFGVSGAVFIFVTIWTLWVMQPKKKGAKD
jgi:hypothetical protein